MATLNVYDPAQCCSTGVCGPDGVDELAQFAANLEWLKQRGVAVSRFNLGHQPEAFAGNAMVRGVLTSEGVGSLPLIVADGQIVSKGRYPSRDELATQLGFEAVAAGDPAPATKRCCG
jgi:hypothetical protein